MYVSLKQIKKHLLIDEMFKEDDIYLLELEEAAEQSVSLHIDRPLSELEDGDGSIPAPLRQAILIFIATQYANREYIAYTNIKELPLSFNFLCDQYRCYYRNPNCEC